MQRFIILITSIIVLAMLLLQGFSPVYPFPQAVEQVTQDESVISDAPEQILSDIYFNNSTIGVSEATPERLELDFGIDNSSYSALWGRYSDGRFGAADVIIMKAKPGKEEDVVEALQTIKVSRINLFQNYDIYNSYDIASNGVILERQDYYILLMLENQADAVAIVESYLPR